MNFKERRIKNILFVCFLATLPVLSWAQMEVTPANVAPYNPEGLMNIFLGEGVDFTNVDFEGDASAVGFFKNANGDIGMEEGIVMTTGFARSAPGLMCPMTCGDTGIASDDNMGLNIETDLEGIVGVPVFDVVKYTIDFVPITDTVTFRYVFASEEYQSFTCSDYNDVFGFFFSGPGIAGPYEDGAINIALIPGTAIPVSINTVNSGTPSGTAPNCDLSNSAYFVQNIGNTSINVEYNGFTTVLTATAVVTPCETYTIKLSLADGGDPNLDSAVFLEANSFGGGSLNVDATTVSIDGTISEGCQGAEITFAAANEVEEDFPLNYQILGTATNGVDYDFIPLDLVIPAGSSSVSVDISGIEDGITEGVETIIIVLEADVCKNDTLQLQISDYLLTEPDLEDETICQGQSVQLDASLPVAFPPPTTFSITPNAPLNIGTIDNPFLNPNYFDINVGGIAFDEIGPDVINSVCIDIEGIFIGDAYVYLVSPSGQVIELTTQNGFWGSNYTETCFTPVATDSIAPPGETAPPEDAPFTGDWLPETGFESLYGSDVNGTWQFVIYDVSSDLLTVNELSITFNNTYDLNYQWLPGLGLSCTTCPNPVAFPTTTTTYSLEITDAYGCSVNDEITINVITDLTAPVVSCGPSSSSTVTFLWDEVPGATAYEVNVNGTGWVPASPGPLSHEVTGLSVGETVTIEVRPYDPGCGFGPITSFECDATSCASTFSLDETTNISCFGADDGTATLSASGASPFNYDIGTSNNDTGLFSGLSAGNYTVTVSDSDNCTSTFPFEIVEPAELITGQSATGEGCAGASLGEAAITVTGGVYPYSYNWDMNPSTDSLLTGLPPGTYLVTVTDDNGCTGSENITVDMSTPIVLDTDSTEATCAGVPDGTATIIPSGGTGSFSYQWDANAGGQTNDTATGLDVGTYAVTVTDGDGCTAEAVVEVTAPNSITTTTDGTPATCESSNDGTAEVTAVGGTGTLDYEWSNGDLTQMANGLDAGWAYVTVTDDNGCFVVDSFLVTVPDPLGIGTVAQDVSCFGDSDGFAGVFLQGGIYPYTFDWGGGQVFTTLSNEFGTWEVIDNGCFVYGPNTISGNNIDTICVSVEDGVDSTSMEVIVSIAPPNTTGLQEYCQQLEVGTTNTFCFPENPAWVSPVSYAICTSSPSPGSFGSWSVDAVTGCLTFTSTAGAELFAEQICIEATDDTGATEEFNVWVSIMEPGEAHLAVCTLGQDTLCLNAPAGIGPATAEFGYCQDELGASLFTGLSMGSYTVTVTDDKGCSESVTIMVNEPELLETSLTPTAVGCFGDSDGSVVSSTTGGTGAYSYDWGGATTPDLNNIPAGLYTLTVTDENGCTAVASTTVTEPPTGVTVDAGIDATVCFNASTGTASATASGGTGPYVYAWSDGSVGENQVGLSADVYEVTVTDAFGCTAVDQMEVLEFPDISSSISVVSPLCYDGNDGTATIDAVSGGSGVSIGDYNFVWNTVPNQTGISATGLQAGQTYEVTITDGFGCTNTNTVIVPNPTEVTVVLESINDVSCSGGADGSIDVEGQGGTGNYFYLWEDGQTTDVASGLAAGNYMVTVTDDNGCTAVADYTINNPSVLELEMFGIDVECYSAATGSAWVEVEGGTLPYLYEWSEMSTADSIANLEAGTYFVTVTDAEGCSAVGSINIEQPEAFSFVTSTEDVFCFGDQDGSVSVEVIGGTPPYLYSINGVDYIGFGTFVGLPAGTYDVFVQDGKGCVTTVSDLVVSEPPPMEVNIIPDSSLVVLELGDSLQLNLNIINNQGDTLIYVWDPELSPSGLNCLDCPAPIFNSSEHNSFEVLVIDGNGCEATDEIEIRVERSREVFVPGGFTPNGDNLNDVLMVHGQTGTKVNTFRVYDRWGELVFRADNYDINSEEPDNVWDGTFKGNRLNPAVFVWYVEVEYIDGRTESFEGNTTLLK